jgi:hypothetical protein
MAGRKINRLFARLISAAGGETSGGAYELPPTRKRISLARYGFHCQHATLGDICQCNRELFFERRGKQRSLLRM